MARKRKTTADISPLHPALHYIVFLILALLLVVVVTGIMQRTAQDTRARLVCPQAGINPVKLIEHLSIRCPDGVEQIQDKNGCNVWVCKRSNSRILPTPLSSPINTTKPLPFPSAPGETIPPRPPMF